MELGDGSMFGDRYCTIMCTDYPGFQEHQGWHTGASRVGTHS